VTVTAAPASPPVADRSGFRNVMLSGAKVGATTALAVVVYLLVTRLLPGAARELLQAVVVLAFALPIALGPAYLVTARQTEGVAGAAAVGLWGTVVFMAFDIIVLRPLKAYPWTWDAVGGGSTWWYLAVWWMLGTFTAWMGGLVTAARHQGAGGGEREPALVDLAWPPAVGGAVVAAVGRVVGCPVTLPVTAGAGFLVTLTALAVVGMARRR
jgi:hypothetical protein